MLPSALSFMEKQAHFYLLLPIPGVSLALWEDFLVEISFFILTKIQDWMGEELVIKLFFFLSKGQKVSPCFSCWFLSDSSSCRKQIVYFLSHFLSQKNGLYWIIFLSLHFSTTFCLGTFYKLQWHVLLPISSFRRFRFLSSSQKWGTYFSRGVSWSTIPESSDSHLRVTLPPEDICHCLETFLFVTAGGSGCSWISWVEAKGALNLPQCIGQVPTTKNHLAHMPIVLKLRNLAIKIC